MCPNKDRCRRCGEPGHFACSCTKNLDPSPVFLVEGPAAPSTSSGGDFGPEPASNDDAANVNEQDVVQNEPIEQSVAPDDQNIVHESNFEVTNGNAVVELDHGDHSNEIMEELDNVVIVNGGDGSTKDPASVDECQNVNTVSIDVCRNESVITVDVESESNVDFGGTNADSQIVNNANIVHEQSDSSVPNDTPGTNSGEDSIMEFSESSESQSILEPKGAPPASYGSRHLLGKAKSSVVSKLLPRKQPVVRSGHHSLPVVVSNKPSLVKAKKR